MRFWSFYFLSFYMCYYRKFEKCGSLKTSAIFKIWDTSIGYYNCLHLYASDSKPQFGSPQRLLHFCLLKGASCEILA